MFDIIGKRRWFYLISLIITIPGLFFILLTPFTDAGLQFTIDYTGGTKLGDPLRGPERHARPGRGGLRRAGPRGDRGHDRARASSRSRPSSSTGPAGSPSPSPGPTRRRRPPAGRPAASGSPGASVRGCQRERLGDGQPEPDAQSRPPARSPSPSGSPAPSASPGASPGPSASPAAADRQHRRSRPRASSAQVRGALETELGPIAEQRSLTTIGAVVSSDLISQALHPDPRRLARDPALDHLPVPRREVRRDRARRAAPRRHRRRRRRSRSSARSSTSRSTPCS